MNSLTNKHFIDRGFDILFPGSLRGVRKASEVVEIDKAIGTINFGAAAGLRMGIRFYPAVDSSENPLTQAEVIRPLTAMIRSLAIRGARPGVLVDPVFSNSLINLRQIVIGAGSDNLVLSGSIRRRHFLDRYPLALLVGSQKSTNDLIEICASLRDKASTINSGFLPEVCLNDQDYQERDLDVIRAQGCIPRIFVSKGIIDPETRARRLNFQRAWYATHYHPVISNSAQQELLLGHLKLFGVQELGGKSNGH